MSKLTKYDYEISAFLMLSRLYICNYITLKKGLHIPKNLAKNLIGAKYVYYKVKSLINKIDSEYKNKNISIELYLVAADEDYIILNSCTKHDKVILGHIFSHMSFG